MTQAVFNALINADKLLSGISVKGNDAYALVEARRLLKIVFDENNKPPEKEAKGEDD
jgi:hypothetical protein